MELMTFGGALVAMKTAGGMVSGGGTVSDDSTGDDAATESEPQPSRDGEADDTAAVTAEGIASDRVSIEDTPDAAASESPAETAGDETDTESEPEPARRPISTQIPKMTG